jgi:N-acetylmuramoyl-L-alanine amidase
MTRTAEKTPECTRIGVRAPYNRRDLLSVCMRTCWKRWVGIAVVGVWAVRVWAAPGEFPAFWHEKEKYVALRDLAAAYGAEASGPFAQRISVQNKWHSLIFKTDSREVLANGTLVWLHEPMQQVRGRWALREVDASRVIDPILRPSRALAKVGYRVVVLDPGHGGQDVGARGARGVEEKRVVLDIARRMRTHLLNAGVKVYMTRESDRFVELDARAQRAARWGADVFVSIHLNSAANSAAAGSETYALAAAGYESTAGGFSNLSQPGNRFEGANGLLAYHVQKALVGRIASHDRGVKRSRFLVLKNAPCPAVLVECGFVSNPREEERLLTEAHREAMAQGLVRGVINYLNLVKRSRAEAP